MFDNGLNMSLKHLGIVSKFFFKYYVNLSELINFYSPWNHQKTVGFLMISGGIKVNQLIKFTWNQVRNLETIPWFRNDLCNSSKPWYQIDVLPQFILFPKNVSTKFLRKIPSIPSTKNKGFEKEKSKFLVLKLKVIKSNDVKFVKFLILLFWFLSRFF